LREPSRKGRKSTSGIWSTTAGRILVADITNSGRNQSVAPLQQDHKLAPERRPRFREHESRCIRRKAASISHDFSYPLPAMETLSMPTSPSHPATRLTLGTLLAALLALGAPSGASAEHGDHGGGGHGGGDHGFRGGHGFDGGPGHMGGGHWESR